jgi:hypothetical protein
MESPAQMISARLSQSSGLIFLRSFLVEVTPSPICVVDQIQG